MGRTTKTEISKEDFVKIAPTLTRNAAARHFGIADKTAQRLADDLGIEFKKYVPKGKGRPKIKLI